MNFTKAYETLKEKKECFHELYEKEFDESTNVKVFIDTQAEWVFDAVMTVRETMEKMHTDMLLAYKLNQHTDKYPEVWNNYPDKLEEIIYHVSLEAYRIHKTQYDTMLEDRRRLYLLTYHMNKLLEVIDKFKNDFTDIDFYERI